MKRVKPLSNIRIFVHNTYVGTFPVDLDWGENYIVRSAMDFLSGEEFLQDLQGKLDVHEETVTFTERKKMMTQKKQTRIIYLCPICDVELIQYDGSGVRRTGVSLYCANKQCGESEVYGFGRDVEHAYRLITEKYKKSSTPNIQNTQEAPKPVEEPKITYYGKIELDKDSKLSYE